MSDITAEKRLELIRSIREENHKNRMNMRSREQILYGRGYAETPVPQDGEGNVLPTPHSTLMLRTIIAAVLFSLFIIMDYLQADWLPVDMNQLSGCLQENYAVDIMDFMDKITDTLGFENLL